MGIQKELQELIQANILDKATADRISDYLNAKNNKKVNPLFVILGVLGCTLIGLGIILIVGHNWDNLNRFTKLVFAFLPMLMSHGACAYVLKYKSDSQLFRESVSTLLFFSIAACISLVSQIYNIEGSISAFLFVWMILALPIIYIMQSPVTSLFYIFGITMYACNKSYWGGHNQPAYFYFLMLAAVLPFYLSRWKNFSDSNSTRFHHWFVPLSLMVCLATIGMRVDELLPLMYACLFSFYMAFHLYFTNKLHWSQTRSYLIIGALGSMIMLMIYSFQGPWTSWFTKSLDVLQIFMSVEMGVIILLSLACIYFLLGAKGMLKIKYDLLYFNFIIFIAAFVLGSFINVMPILINLLILVIGIQYIMSGIKLNKLSVLNFGLISISILIMMRFFDTSLGFLLRGIVAMALGGLLILINYRMIKKMKSNES